MLAVTVGADGRVGFATGHELAVDPLPEVVLDSLVTLATGRGYVEVIDRRLRVAGREDAVRRARGRVAVIAGRRDIHTTPGRLTVHAGLVDLDRMVDQDFVLRGEVEILVALSTGLRQLGGMCPGGLDR